MNNNWIKIEDKVLKEKSKEEEFDSFMKSINMPEKRKNQFEFYSNIIDFLKSDKQIMIARGGMALGKTIATSLAIKQFLFNYNQSFIATPYSKVKGEWCDELNKLRMQTKYTEWLTKKDCIPKFYHNDANDCKDDCEHRIHLEEKKDGYTEYSPECIHLFNSLNFPLNAFNWYNENGYKSCLISPIRYGLKNTNIAIGDFIPVIIENMMNNIIYKETDKGGQFQSLLTIDEGHRFPQRVENYLSKELNISHMLKKLKDNNEQKKLYNNSFYPNIHIGIKTLKKLELNLKKIIKEAPKEKIKCGQIRYTLQNFKQDFEKSGDILFNEFYKSLLLASKKLSTDEYETEDDPFLKRLYKFLENWIKKEPTGNYHQYFQYSEFKNGEVKLKLTCDNVDEEIRKRLRRWKKVIILSGTIHENFIESIGFNKEEIYYPPQLNSFSIKDDVLIYSNYTRGSFWKGYIDETIKKDAELILKIINKTKGRILIFLINKEKSKDFEKVLSNKKIFNLCFKKGDDYKNQIKNFSNSKNGIALLNIKGRVEGTNFIDEDGDTIENIIVYGYPNEIPNWELDDKLRSNIKKYKDRELAMAYINYIPTGNIIHQACCRSKRKEKDKPLILLMGDMYNKNMPQYKFLPDDLSGQHCHCETDLLNNIELKNERRSKKNI